MTRMWVRLGLGMALLASITVGPAWHSPPVLDGDGKGNGTTVCGTCWDAPSISTD